MSAATLILPRSSSPRSSSKVQRAYPNNLAPLTIVRPRTLARTTTPAPNFSTLLPMPRCSMGELMAREVLVDGGGLVVYLVRDTTEKILYVGQTMDDVRERFRRHATERHAGHISLFDKAIAATPEWVDWTITVAPADAFATYVSLSVARLRRQLGGQVSTHLAKRLDALRRCPDNWASAAVVEWALIATIAPEHNRKGNVYGEAPGRAARPLALLKRYAFLADRQIRRDKERRAA